LLEIRTDADDDEVVNWILLVFQLTSRQLTSRPRTFQARPSQASIQLLLTEEPQAFWPVGDIFTIKISKVSVPMQRCPKLGPKEASMRAETSLL